MSSSSITTTSPRDAAAAGAPGSAVTGSVASIRVFRRYIAREHMPDGSTKVDASAINSKACYEEWLSTRGVVPPDPAKCFQRTLTAHLTGADGRMCFEPDEEAAVLLVLREKRQWPAFVGTDASIGSKGFRSMGFHEKSRLFATQALPHLTASNASASLMSEERRPKKKRKESADAPVPALPPFTSPLLPRAGLDDEGQGFYSLGTRSFSSYDDFASLIATPQMPAPRSLADATPPPPPPPQQPTPPQRTASSAATSRAAATTRAAAATADFKSLPAMPKGLVSTPGVFESLPTQPSVHEARAALVAFEQAHPGCAAVAVNTLANSLDELFLAQSDISVTYLGAVAKSHAGKARALVPPGAEVGWARRALQAARSGRELDFTDRILVADGSAPWLRMKMRLAGLVLVVGTRVA